MSPTNFPGAKDNYVRPTAGTILGGARKSTEVVDDAFDAIEAIEDKLLKEVLSVRDKGALGDSTDSSTAIQSAIDAANTAGGGIVFAPAGTYILNTAITLRSGVSLVGVPGKTIFRVKNATQINAFVGTNITDVLLDGFVLDLNKANITNLADQLNQLGIYIQATTAAGCKNVTIRRLTVKDGHQVGIRPTATTLLTNPLEITIEDCEVTGMTSHGIRTVRCSGAVVQNNRCSGNDVGIVDINSERTRIIGNLCRGNAAGGIVVNTVAKGTVVSGNVSNANGTDTAGNLGWGINISDRCTDFTVSGNVCVGNLQGGISCDTLQAGFPTTLTDSYGDVVGNVCTDSSGTNASHGISIQGMKGGNVVGNLCRNNKKRGINLNSRSIVCEGNTLINNVLSGILLNGQNGGAFTPAGGFYVIGPNVYEGNPVTIAEDPTVVGTNRIQEGPQPIILNVGDLELFSGSPNRGTIAGGRQLAWLMDAAAGEVLATNLSLPAPWPKVKVSLLWVNAGAGTGDVRWVANLSNFADGADLNVGEADNATVVTAAAQNILKRTTLVASHTVTAGNLLRLRVWRDAANAADTLGNDAGIVSVVIEPVWS